MTIKGWVGFTKGKLHFYSPPSYYFNLRRADFFDGEQKARACYLDVRRATLIIEDPKKREKK